MASYAQSSLHVEIQDLKDALAASEKKADRHAQLIVTLSVELDYLRSGLCDPCKKRLAPSNAASVPPNIISAGQDSTGTTTSSVSAPLWRRVFEGRQISRPTTDNMLSIGLSRSLAASPNTNKPLLVPSEPEVAHNLCSSQTTPTPANPGSIEYMPPEQDHAPVKWSVVYHPEVERALEFHLAHVFTHDSAIYCIHMSPDGQRLAVGLLDDGKTFIYELKTGSNICVLVDRYVKDSVDIWSAQFSPDSQILATGAGDGQIRIWDLNIKKMRAMLKGHKGTVYDVVFSPSGRLLVSGSADNSVRIWNTHDGSSKVLPVTGAPSSFICVIFGPDGRYVAAGNADNSLWIWDSRTQRLVAKWWGHTGSVWSAVFTPDGKGLISGALDDTVKYWDMSLLGSRQGASALHEEGFPLVRNFLGHKGGINSIAFILDSNAEWIVTGSDDESVRVWDTESGVYQLTLQGHVDWIEAVDVSRTQNFVATAGADGHVAVWKYMVL